MRYHADLHIHSKHSRATSSECDLEHLALWARRKGITVLGTGDFTHPAWRAELKEKLVPAEPGLFRLRPALEAEVEARVPAACQGPTRFLLSVEISTIYKKGERTRKVHHLAYASSFEEVDRMVARLARIGNLASDGRPILGLDSRHLLEIVLESGSGAFLIPAHAWTPWFAVLGSHSGFDSVAECYGDLAPHIFALETGLSSDPPMNWRVSSLDRYRLVSSSDAHSPEKIGREACVFDTELDYFALRHAMETGAGYVGTVEFFPEEGKYHLDGHRKCGVRLTPRETLELAGRCPSCANPVTVGVLHRIEMLANRGEGVRPTTAGEVHPLVALPEILAEILGTGPGSRGVEREWERLTARLGPELWILEQAPLEDVGSVGSPLLAEALSRLRRGLVRREAGYDGEYGRIRLFEEGELRRLTLGGGLFPAAGVETAVSGSTSAAAGEPTTAPPPAPFAAEVSRQVVPPALTDGLDEDQRAAVEIASGPLLIVAGPGSGKTQTLTHRIAHLVPRHGAAPESCLTITFTRRAAEEMRARLRALLPHAAGLPVFTFHGLGHAILRTHADAAGLREGFEVADEATRLCLLREALGLSAAQARRWAERIGRLKRMGAAPEASDEAQVVETYERALQARGLVDLEDLVARAVALLEAEPEVAAGYRKRYRWVSVDEFQDIDPIQYRLLRDLVPSDGNLCAIGDPDQAIYGFRGADVGLFRRLQRDYAGLRTVHLNRNYRSTRTIVEAAGQVIAPVSASPPAAEAMGDGPDRVILHEAPTERAEAEFVVQALEQLFGGHTFFSIDSGRAVGPGEADLAFSDVALLYRTESQAAPLAEALARSGIPFQRRSHRPLSDHPGVEVLVARLRGGSGEGPLRARLETAARAAAEEVDAPTLAAGLELLSPLAEACGADLSRLLWELSSATEMEAWDPRAERLSLLTLHAAKGLEFRVVFIVGCEDGLLPLRWSGDDEALLAEERRLFYVGMTRAKERLFLCRARRRAVQGRIVETAASPFLRDIQEQLLERRLTTARPRLRQAEQRRLF